MLSDTDKNQDNDNSTTKILSEEDLCKAFGGHPDISQLNFFSNQFSNALNDLKFYFDTLTKFFEDREAKQLEHLKEELANVPKSRQEEYLEYFVPSHSYLKDMFEDNLKSSFVVSLFTHLEVYLFRICQISGPRDTFKKKIIKKPGFPDKYCEYLSKQLKFDFGSLDWDKIKKLWKVRNAIAHNDGLCLEEKRLEKLRKFIDDVDGISMINHGTSDDQLYWIGIDPLFCKTAFDIIQKFGWELGNLIREHISGSEIEKGTF